MSQSTMLRLVEKVGDRWCLLPVVEQQEQEARRLMEERNFAVANRLLRELRQRVASTILDEDHPRMQGADLDDWLRQSGSDEVIVSEKLLRELACENRRRWKETRVSQGDFDPEAAAQQARQQTKVCLDSPSAYSYTHHSPVETWSSDRTVLVLRDMDPFWDGTADGAGYQEIEIWDLLSGQLVEKFGKSMDSLTDLEFITQDVADTGHTWVWFR